MACGSKSIAFTLHHTIATQAMLNTLLCCGRLRPQVNVTIGHYIYQFDPPPPTKKQRQRHRLSFASLHQPRPQLNVKLRHLSLPLPPFLNYDEVDVMINCAINLRS